jgi:CO/xanthine dehydrogenase FAD-binding subunit
MSEQDRRVRELRVAFRKQMPRPHRLLNAEKLILTRAAQLTALAERCAGDPNVPINDVIRMDHCAARARAAWARLIAAKPAAQPTLQDYREAMHGAQAR